MYSTKLSLMRRRRRRKKKLKKKALPFFFFCKENSSRKNHILPWENYLGKDAAKCVLLTAKFVNLQWIRITYFCAI